MTPIAEALILIVVFAGVALALVTLGALFRKLFR